MHRSLRHYRRTALLGILSLALRAADPPLSIEPAFQRVDVTVGERRELHLRVRSTTAATLVAVESDCACIHAVTAVPSPLTADVPLDLEVSVLGMVSGMKPVTVRTDRGAATMTLQVVTGGIGVGHDQLAAAARLAIAHGSRCIILSHDLRGQLRNCGCSAGSLGGIDRLAALPGVWRTLAPEVDTRFVLSGDPDGSATGVGAALCEHGWQVGDAAIAVGMKAAAALATPGIVAVVPSGPVEVHHRRIVQPPLADGMVAMVLLIGRDGEIEEQRVIPIDQSLPADAQILGRFPDAATRPVVSVPASDACLACHDGAHRTWAASAHARAWAALTPANRTDGCVTCHSTPLEDGTLTTGVHCQDCHAGAAAHVANPTAVHLGAAVDCRSCHDARHHPEFDRKKAWDAIVHGR